MFKRSLALLLCMTILLSAWIIPVAAEVGNVSMTVTGENLKVGDTFTVSLSTVDMKVATFGAIITFDPAKLECQSISGFRPAAPDRISIKKVQLDEYDSSLQNCTAVSTTESANKDGVVSAGFPGTDDIQCLATENFLNATFKILAVGDITLKLEEQSSGTNGYQGEVGTKTVTVKAVVPTPEIIGVTATPATVVAGGQTTLSAGVNGAPTGYTQHYQWQKLEGENWVDILDATNFEHSLTAPNTPGSYQYRVRVWHADVASSKSDEVIGGPLTITVTPAPLAIPTSVSVSTDRPNAFTGETPKLSVTATGSDGLTLNYQWQQKDGADWKDISGATSADYVLALTEAGTFEYRALVWNTKEGAAPSEKATSDSIFVYVDTPAAKPIVTISQDPTIVYLKNNVTLTANVQGAVEGKLDGGDLTYQWYMVLEGIGTVPMASATESVITIRPQSVAEHEHEVTVTNTKKHFNDAAVLSVSSTTENHTFTVSTVPGPSITTDLPTDAAKYFVSSTDVKPLEIQAEPVAGGTLSYQWYSRAVGADWVKIDEATSASYTPSVNSIGITEYKVVVTNTISDSNAAVTSAVAKVIVVEKPKAPTITMPADITVWVDDEVTIEPSISAPETDENAQCTQRYFWYMGDGSTRIEDALNASFKPSTAIPGVTNYWISVVNMKSLGSENNMSASRKSSPVKVTVVAKAAAPVITAQPVPKSYTVNETPVALSVTVDEPTDGSVLSYQWYMDGAEIEGATSSTYTPATTATGSVKYYVVVTSTKTVEGIADSTKATTTSTSALISVSTDPAFAEAMEKLNGIVIDVPYNASEDYVLDMVTLNVAFKLQNSTISVVYADSYKDITLTQGVFNCTLTLSNGKTTEAYKLTATVNYAPNPSIKPVQDALAAVAGVNFTNVAQAADETTTKANAAAAVLAEATAALTGTDVTLEVVEISFTNAIAGTLSSPSGTNGTYKFKIKASANVDGGDPYDEVSGEFTIAILAKAFTDADRVAAAMEVLAGMDLTKFVQTTPNDADTVAVAIKQKIEAELVNYGVTVVVASSAFQAPVAGSASTSKDGTPGSITFTVTLSSNAVSQTTDAKNATITATPFTGVLDRDAFNAAITALNGLNNTNIYVDFGAVEATIKAMAEEAIVKVLNALQVGGQTATVDSTMSGTVAPDKKSCTYTVTVVKGINNDSKNITFTVVEGENPAIKVVAAAKDALNKVAFADIPYASGLVEASVESQILQIAVDAIKNSAVAVELINTSFTQAVPGTSAQPIATQGVYTFTIQFSAGVDAAKVTDTIGPKTIKITANDFSGVSDEKAVEYAENAINALSVSIDQSEAATAEAAEAAIKAKLIEAINALGQQDGKANAAQNLAINVVVSAFVPAEAGSAATTAAGKNGALTLTVSVEQGAYSYAPAAEAIVILATPFTGILDSEAVFTAKNNLKDGQVIVPIRPTDAQIRAEVEKYIKTALVGKAEGVTAVITAAEGNVYTVSLTKGSKTDSKKVTINWKEADPIKLDKPENVVFEKGVVTWDAVQNAEAYLVTLYLYDQAGNTKVSSFRTTELLIDLSSELNKGKSYQVSVKAIADGVYNVDGDETISGEIYTLKNDSMYDNYWFWVLLNVYNRSYAVTATAGEGGTISPAGVSAVKHKRNVTYTITPDEGYIIEAVWVDGENLGAVTEYTFKKVMKAHQISVTFTKPAWEGPFTDLEKGGEYEDAIRFVYENGLIAGVTETEFAPETAITRAELVTALGRMVEMDTIYYMTNAFTDVASDAEYAPYVAWAVDAKLMQGNEDGTFGVSKALTVEEAVSILMRYAAYLGLATDSAMALDSYTDASEIAERNLAAMQWAVEQGVYAGEKDTLVPAAEVSRALIADMLYSFAALVD